MPDGGQQQSGIAPAQRMGLEGAQERLRLRRGRGRRLSVAAALVTGGAALLFWPVQWGAAVYGGLWGLALLLAASLLAGRTGDGAPELDEEARRALAVRWERFHRRADWLVGIGVVLLVNGLLMLTLMRQEGTRWALALGMAQAGAGCFLCLDMWTTSQAYRWMLRD